MLDKVVKLFEELVIPISLSKLEGPITVIKAKDAHRPISLID